MLPTYSRPNTHQTLLRAALEGVLVGLQRMGGLNLALSVVGYSLPPYDAYAQQDGGEVRKPAPHHRRSTQSEACYQIYLGNLRRILLRACTRIS